MQAQLVAAQAAEAPHGVLFPEQVLHTPLFGLLAAFVAVNTIVYVALAVVKMLPSLPLGTMLNRRNRRGENRSIYPDAATRAADTTAAAGFRPSPATASD